MVLEEDLEELVAVEMAVQVVVVGLEVVVQLEVEMVIHHLHPLLKEIMEEQQVLLMVEVEVQVLEQ